mmetsp:Transcript_69830/g.186221  ORF Transcript_69830/g.186221 Transcript_69830/m.186221 type:complete len:81 (-) Transcript_69830:107-349(-)
MITDITVITVLMPGLEDLLSRFGLQRDSWWSSGHEISAADAAVAILLFMPREKLPKSLRLRRRRPGMAARAGSSGAKEVR